MARVGVAPLSVLALAFLLMKLRVSGGVANLSNSQDVLAQNDRLSRHLSHRKVVPLFPWNLHVEQSPIRTPAFPFSSNFTPPHRIMLEGVEGAEGAGLVGDRGGRWRLMATGEPAEPLNPVYPFIVIPFSRSLGNHGLGLFPGNLSRDQ